MHTDYSEWTESVQSIKMEKGGRKMEDDVEVRNDGQQLQKTRAWDVKGKMSSPTINEKETEIHGTKSYEKEVKADRGNENKYSCEETHASDKHQSHKYSS